LRGETSGSAEEVKEEGGGETGFHVKVSIYSPGFGLNAPNLG
jgi:hypothetical protein